MIVYREINGVKFGVDPHKAAGLMCTNDVAEIIDGNIYDFIEYLYDQKKEYTPMVATWELTNTCNFSCPFCYINTNQKKKSITINYQIAKHCIDELVECGLLLVYLTGGEVLSVPDFPEIYRYLKQKGVFIVLLTNLSLFSEQHKELFLNLPPLRITASIYGLSKKQFCSITGQDYSVCRKITKDIICLKNLGINITCQMPVTKITSADFSSIADWCYDNNIRFTFDNELTDSYYGESRNNYVINDEKFSLMSEGIKQIPSEISKKQPEVIKKFGYKCYFDCIAGKHTFAISAEGIIRPCFNIWEKDWYSFNGNKSMKIALSMLKGIVESQKNTPIEGCHGCEASNICGECLYTRLKAKGKYDEYLQRKCKDNLQIISKLTEVICTQNPQCH